MSLKSDLAETPAWVWYLLGVISGLLLAIAMSPAQPN